MLRIVLGVTILLVCSPAWATVSRVQSNANFTGSGSTCTATFPTTSSANDLAKDIAGESANTVTVNFSASTPGCSIVIVEYNGPNQNSPLAISSPAIGTGRNLDSGIAMPTFANELVIGEGTVSTGTAIAGNGFNSPQSNGGNLAEGNTPISNAKQHATASSSISENSIMQIATFRDLRNIWSGSQSSAGPRPWIDVTAYGAKGDASTNDTAAIQSAINAACATSIGGQNVYPIIIFPPGHYFVAQPQLPSTAPVFEIPCSFLTFRGMGTSGPTAGARVPQVIIQAIPGASPNGAPIFDCRFTSGCAQDITLQDLNLEGYNKALWIYKAVQNKLDNVTLFVQNTGMADNSALELTNTFWFEWNGGTCAGIEAANKYCILMTGDVSMAGEAPLVGLTYIHNLQGIGGMIRYDQRVNTTGSGPGNWAFDNIRGWEANQGPFIYITNSTGNPDLTALPQINQVSIYNVTSADSGGAGLGYALIEDTAATALFGVEIHQSLAGNGGSPAIQLDKGINGQLGNCYIWAARTSFTANGVVDGSGNPMPGCVVNNNTGYDYTAGNTGSFQGNLRSDDVGGLGPAFRDFLTGNRYAGVGLDPTFGLMLNTGNDFGFNSGVGQTVRNRMDIEFPNVYPPTGVAGSPTTGGSISPGTYYGTIYSTTNGASCNSTESAPSMQSAAVTVSGSNNAIKWTWTLPVAGVQTVQGYCISVSTSPNLDSSTRVWQPQQVNWNLVTGATTTTYSMTTLPSAGGVQPLNSTLVPAHSFTPSSLGINTTNPACSLDVRGTIHASKNVIVGLHLDSGTSNSDLDGTIAINGATVANHSFATAFSVAPSCVIVPTSDPTSVGTWWVTTSTSAVSAHVQKSGTITFNYHCTGNPD